MTSRQLNRSYTGQLPALAYSYQDDGVDDGQLMTTPRRQQQLLQQQNGHQTTARISYLEDRLSQQERTTNDLLDRALKIKKDVIDSLDVTHGTWQEEKQARQLLQDHIRTITDVVKKLNRDIEYLENQMRERDGTAFGTHAVVKNLEMNQVAGVTDLRGRVVRCDASIARLSADLKTAFDSIQNVTQFQQNQNSKIVDNLHMLDTRIRDVKSILDKSSTEQTMQLQQVQTGTSFRLTDLDSKTRIMTDELKHELQIGRTNEQNEREKLEARIVMHFEKALSQRDARLEKLQQKMEENLSTAHVKMLRLEEETRKETERAISAQEMFENRLRTSVDGSLQKQNDEIAKVKRESRAGFSTVHEAIADMKLVLEGKLKIVDEQLRKEISQLRKMVVLI